MIRAHQIVDDILSDEILCPNIEREDGIKRRKWLRDIVGQLIIAQKFDITPMVMSIGSLSAVNVDFNGLMFPFDQNYVEFEFDGKNGRRGVYALLILGSTEANTFCAHVFLKDSGGPWADVGISVDLGVDGYKINRVSASTPDRLFDSARAAVKMAVVSFALLQSGSGSQEIETVSQRLNKRRVESGACPVFEHRIVRIAPRHAAAAEAKGGTHASPAQHWRRGHVRTMRSGRRVNVRPCTVGNLSNGFVSHDYVVKP